MTKNKLSIAPPDKKKTLEAFFRYYELSRLLFGQKQNEIYDVTDIPKTNKFYELVKEIAKQLEIDWENMTHEEAIERIYRKKSKRNDPLGTGTVCDKGRTSSVRKYCR